MDGAGGPPTSRAAPDRAARLAFYRRRHAPHLRSLRRRAVGFGAAAGLFAGAIVLLIDLPVPLAIIIGVALALAFGGGLQKQWLEVHDHLQTDAPLSQDLPAFDTLTFHWAGPGDIDEIDAALDDRTVAANHWTEQDRADVLTIPFLPGVVVASLTWVVRDRKTGALVAGTSCELDPADPALASMGIWLAPAERGHGRGTEVLERAVPLALTCLRAPTTGFSGDTSQLTLSTDIGNVAMRRTAERAGGEEIGEYQHRFADGSTATAIRYRFQPDLPSGPTATGPGSRPSKRRRRLVALAAIVLVALALATWVRSGRDRDDGPQGVWGGGGASVQQVLDDDQDVPYDLIARAPGPIDPDDTVVEDLGEATTTWGPSGRDAVLASGGIGDGSYDVIWEPVGTRDLSVRLLVRAPGTAPVTESVTTVGLDGRIAAEKIHVGDGGSILVALVSPITTEVRYRAAGRGEITVPTIDLTARGAYPGAPLAVAIPVPDQTAGSILTTVDGRGVARTLRIE